MALKVLLVETGEPTIQQDMRTTAIEPLSLCYLGAIAKQAGHKVKIIQQLDEQDKNVLKKAIRLHPKLIRGRNQYEV